MEKPDFTEDAKCVMCGGTEVRSAYNCEQPAQTERKCWKCGGDGGLKRRKDGFFWDTWVTEPCYICSGKGRLPAHDVIPAYMERLCACDHMWYEKTLQDSKKGE
jgi:DnaJ-class molecular chaperone